VLKKFIILAYLSTPLKLHLTNISGINVFTGYGEDYVMVNKQRHEQNMVVLRDRLLTSWRPAGFDDLNAEHFAMIAELEPEIVLLGTGNRLRFPRPELTRALTEARIGLEVMDLKAACRTYNFIAAEERKVAAALLFR
jgi:uncharacterized protein